MTAGYALPGTHCRVRTAGYAPGMDFPDLRCTQLTAARPGRLGIYRGPSSLERLVLLVVVIGVLVM